MDVEELKTFVEHADDAQAIADNDRLSEAEKKKIQRKLDLRLVGTVGLLYCCAMLDRTNLSVASIAGMTDELNLIGNRYSVITLTFFITYVAFQPVATLLCRWIGPRIFIPVTVTIWGVAILGMGFLKTWGGMVGLRLVLGGMEAGFFPSCVYLLSTWYTRFEIGSRYSVFYSLGVLASGFGGIIAYGLINMDGLGGLGGWSWIFVIEGIITSFVGILGYTTLVGFPDDLRGRCRFLSDSQLAYVVEKVERDRGDSQASPFTLKKYLHGGLDIAVWIYAMMAFCNSTVLYALAYFLPIILQDNMGFDTGLSQILLAPPYVMTAFAMYGAGWLGDRLHTRGPILIGLMFVSITGLAMMGFADSSGVRYFGVFLVTGGSNSAVPVVMSYQANNIRGQWKRAFASALFVALNGIGGIAGCLVFRSQDKPGYRPGLYACFACSALNIVMTLCLMAWHKHLNKKANSGQIQLEMEDEGSTQDFRYTI